MQTLANFNVNNMTDSLNGLSFKIIMQRNNHLAIYKRLYV